MASPNQVIFLLLQIPLVLLLSFSAQPSLAQFRPICITQFALANQACSVLPSSEVPVVADRAGRRQNSVNNNISRGDNDHHHDHHDDHEHRHEHDKNGDREHNGGHDHRHEHGHEHDNARRRHGHHNIPRAYKDCCRWLEEVDHACVCEALLRLPPFLIKHRHKYTIQVEEVCRFTYKCHSV